jgi:hypothetical protein
MEAAEKKMNRQKLTPFQQFEKRQIVESYNLRARQRAEAIRIGYNLELEDFVTNVDTIVSNFISLDKPLQMAMILYSHKFDSIINDIAGKFNEFYENFQRDINRPPPRDTPAIWQAAFLQFFGEVRSALDYAAAVHSLAAVLNSCRMFLIKKRLTVRRLLILRRGHIVESKLLDPAKFMSTTIFHDDVCDEDETDEQCVALRKFMKWLARTITYADLNARGTDEEFVFVKLLISLGTGLAVLPVYENSMALREAELCVLPQPYVFLARRSSESDGIYYKDFGAVDDENVIPFSAIDRASDSLGRTQLLRGIRILTYDVVVKRIE